MEPIEKSYLRQAEMESEMEQPSRFTRPDSVDNWRHTRMLDLTRAFWEVRPDSRWMTVGDGQYASDAAYLHANGINVVATSLTETVLRLASEQGHIRAFRVENAECISAPDDSYDFILCKESYHHFPRPPIALYEMVRVCRIAVVLIEPLDNPRILDGAKRMIKTMIRGDREHEFEPSGNFLYRLSVRELEKLMSAAGGEVLAFKGINDFYHRRLAGYAAGTFNLGTVVTRFGIWVQDVLASVGLLGRALGCVAVFKSGVPSDIRGALKSAGFTIIDLPRNPFIVKQ